MPQRKYKDLTGQRFGRLTAINSSGAIARGDGKGYYKASLCQCDCGNTRLVINYKLTSGKITSCGCGDARKGKTPKDLQPGERFGKLVVINNSERLKGDRASLCQCDCGNIKVVRNFTLWRNETKSCGCLLKGTWDKYVDLAGKKFGQFTVLERAPSTHRDAAWKCLCECGNIRIHDSSTLTLGKSTKCSDCHYGNNDRKASSWRGFGEISKSYWNNVINGARERDLEFTIDIQFGWELFLKQDRKCALSGYPLIFTRPLICQTASLDRIDSEKGYTRDNTQWTHKMVNLMKREFSEYDFTYWCKEVADYQDSLIKW